MTKNFDRRRRAWEIICAMSMLFMTISAQSLAERYSSYGTMIVRQFSTAPFPHPLRANGHTYARTQYPAEHHYRDSSVAIFIPKGYRAAERTDIVVYFHGWNNSIDSACAQFQLIEQFAEANKNALFVFPEGPKNAPDSFGGRLEETDGLKNLLADVLRTVREQGGIGIGEIGKVILAGHSGAYRVISYCLLRGGVTADISDVILFDALYGQTEKFAYWIDHYPGRLINIYTDDGGTKNESENLMADLTGWGIPYVASEERTLDPDVLRTHRLIFIHTDLSHNEVISVRRQFRTFLITSKLDNIH